MVLDLEGGGNETTSRIRPPGDMNAGKAAHRRRRADRGGRRGESGQGDQGVQRSALGLFCSWMSVLEPHH